MGNDDHRLGQVRESTRGLTHEFVEDASIEIHDVRRLLNKDVAAHGGELVRNGSKLVGDRPFRDHQVGLDPSANGIAERWVSKEADMKLEDLGRLGPELDPCPISELFKFADGFFECGIDPFDLHFDVGRLDSAMRHPLLGLTEAKDASEHDAGRNGDAANHFHRRKGCSGNDACT